MAWLSDLFTLHSVAQTVLIYSLVIALGIVLGHIRLYGISLGITWILFVGIAFSYFGLTVNEEIGEFLRDFGLILFVYAIGLQVGPGFFASLNRNAIANNLLAGGVVVLGVVVTIIFYLVTENHIGIMAGLMSGAVTNTPGLGAARTALADLNVADVDPTMVTLAYAVAYPFGVFGIILSLLVLKGLFNIDINREERFHQRLASIRVNKIVSVTLRLENPQLIGEPLRSLNSLLASPVIVSRMWHENHIITPSGSTLFSADDVLLIVTPRHQLKTLKLLIGDVSDLNLKEVSQSEVVDRLIVVTRPDVTHQRIGEIPELRNADFNISRLMRAGVEIIPNAGTFLQLGDTVRVVGTREGIDQITKTLGNSPRHLDVPNLAPIFLGIVLGVIIGSLPITIPGIPAPVKIGLAAGPLIIAMLLSRFGGRVYLSNYTTHSANLMIRELGITLFLASIGLASGHNLARAFAGGRGVIWMFMGAFITVIPLLTVGYLSKKYFRKSYFELAGLLAGASTDPPALAFAVKMTGSDIPSTTYATVYPFAMILRIVSAQLIILFFI